MKKTVMLFSMILSTSSALATANANTYTLNCGGTEPFWSLKVDGQAVTYSSPEALKGVSYFDAKTTEAAGMTAGAAFQITASRKKGKEKVSLSILKANEQGCSDGMSETVYTHHILANINGLFVYGCCK